MNRRSIKTYVAAGLFMFGFFAFFARAENTIVPELYISAQGDAYFLGAEITRKHAANLLAVSVWGITLSITTDESTVFESAGGAAIRSEEILPGHILEITGRPAPEGGTVAAKVLRDLSIKTGRGGLAAISEKIEPVKKVALPKKKVSQTASMTRSTKPAPPSDQKTSSRVPLGLTKDLGFGMQGKEVSTLQQFLQKHGWGIPKEDPVSGYFGKVTASALKNFQRVNGLAAVGVADAKTRALINQWLHK